MARRGSEGKLSAARNNQTFIHYLNRLKELAVSMFEWKNVPDTVDIRYLELTLMQDGMAIFFNDEELGYLGLQVMIGGNLNVYRIPIIRRAYAVNGYSKDLNPDDSVIIFNNMLHTNSIMDLEMFALKLYECDRTIDVNIKAQKTPVAILCDENQRLVMKNLYLQYDGNMPFIFGSKNLDIKQIQAINTGAPFVADKVMETKNQVWNEALTYLGISNTSYQKKERLISDEVIRNMGGTIASRYSRLSERQKACDMINRMFGLNMSVDYREDVQQLVETNIEYTGGTTDE